APGRVRRCVTVAGDGRHLRRGRLYGRTANWGNRCANGVGRTNDGCAAAGGETGDDAGGVRLGRRAGDGAGTGTADSGAIVSSFRKQSGFTRGDGRVADVGGVAGVFVSRAQSEPVESGGSAASGVAAARKLQIP